MQNVDYFYVPHYVLNMRRKITETLEEWLLDDRMVCPVIYGARQVGKTYSVEEFGKNHFKSYLRLDFATNPEDADIFDGNLDVDTIVMNITAKYPEVRLVPGETMLFFDEIQDCPRARASLKSFAKDELRRYRVVASGSLLGLHLNEVPQIPIGSEKRIFMGPMDFEEYLWAVGMSEDTLEFIRDHIRRKEPFDETFLGIIMQHFRRYMLVGGMPEAVSVFVKERKFDGVREVHRDLVKGYMNDIEKHSEKSHRGRVESCFRSIPAMLAKPNKRFVYADIEGGPEYRVGKDYYGYSLDWLRMASIALLSSNLTELAEPLEEHVILGNFKLYLIDTGLLMSMYSENVAFGILNGDVYVNQGAIVENAVAVMLRLQGRKLMHYDRREEHIEVDFVTVIDGDVTAIEVKSGRNTRSASLNKALKAGAAGIMFETRNIFVDDRGVTHYPLFAAAFLDCIDRQKIPEVDLSDVDLANSIASGRENRRRSDAVIYRDRPRFRRHGLRAHRQVPVPRGGPPVSRRQRGGHSGAHNVAVLRTGARPRGPAHHRRTRPLRGVLHADGQGQRVRPPHGGALLPLCEDDRLRRRGQVPHQALRPGRGREDEPDPRG